MATSFVQMAYNLTDMLWLGRVGTKAVLQQGLQVFYLVWLLLIYDSQNRGQKGCAQSMEGGHGKG